MHDGPSQTALVHVHASLKMQAKGAFRDSRFGKGFDIFLGVWWHTLQICGGMESSSATTSQLPFVKEVPRAPI